MFSIYALNSCKSNGAENKKPSLLNGFQNPPAEARPFVRWWWNGNKIKTEELDRELELLHKAGFGGVEINPIAMPKVPNSDDVEAMFLKDNQGTADNESLVWMSDPWIDMVVHACKKAKDLGMITDMIAGTGWPFGGEFLKDEETSQRMVVDNIAYDGGAVIEVTEDFLINLYKRKYEKTRTKLPYSRYCFSK